MLYNNTMAKKQKNDPYAICTAQKKKSGMGHDAWKRCVDKIKRQEESTMKFLERVKLAEKRRVKEMGNKEGGTDSEVDPKGDDGEEEEKGQAEMDAEDAGLGEAAKKKDKDWIQKAVDPDHEGYCTPMTKPTCTPKRKALAKTFKKMGRKRDREIKAKDEK
jgi:hypothetical protein